MGRQRIVHGASKYWIAFFGRAAFHWLMCWGTKDAPHRGCIGRGALRIGALPALFGLLHEYMRRDHGKFHLRKVFTYTPGTPPFEPLDPPVRDPRMWGEWRGTQLGSRDPSAGAPGHLWVGGGRA